MSATIFAFDPRPGGGYRMAFVYPEQDRATPSSTKNADIVTGRFVEFIPDEKIVETVAFESEDPAFAGTMTLTTTLTPVNGGTKVRFTAENVPVGINCLEIRTMQQERVASYPRDTS